MAYTQIYDELYPNLFSPLKVRDQILKNRIVTAPTHHSFVTDPDNNLNDKGVLAYGSRAKGGAAVVTIGEGKIDNLNSCAHSGHVNFTDEKALQRLHYFTDYVHTYRALASIEFNHSGHFALPQYNPQGLGPMSASAFTTPAGIKVREMNKDDMEQVADSYAYACMIAKRAGFDLILLHFAHGWLMGGFLSPTVNHRTDEYGGSIENRLRFPRMVLERIRKELGRDILLEVRLSGSEMTKGGLEIEDTVEIAKGLEEYVDMMHISCGTRLEAVTRAVMHPSHFVTEHAHNKHFSKAVKDAGVKIPVGVVGAVTDPKLSDELIGAGYADYVVMARAVIADPDWAKKAREGRAEDIRPCIRCFRCLDVAIGRVNSSTTAVAEDFKKSTRKSECSVNPMFGHNMPKMFFPPAEKQKKVVVIGGGPGGMQAALEAAERGHEVTLYEAGAKLGGQLFYADHVWFKGDMKRYREYLIRQVEKAKIEVILNTKATPEMVYQLRPDAVIVAIGADALIPPIPGVDGANVLTGIEVYGHEDKVGHKAVIIGGGMVGCETALHLTHLGHEVELVEMGEMVAPEGIFTERIHTVWYMDHDEKLQYHVNTKCTEITAKGIKVVDKEGKERFIAADTVILSSGMKSRAQERDSFNGVAFDVIPVGDCRKVGTVHSAVSDGFNAALTL